MQTEQTTIEDIFGECISSYSRAQAIADGVLVDVTEADGVKGHFKFPVAMTAAAYGTCVAVGGTWEPSGNDQETLKLPGGQDHAGRLHDICTMLKATMRNPQLDPEQRRNSAPDRVYFSVLVDAHGDGHKKRVELWSLCGPGDDPRPVITIMLRGED